MANTAPQVLGVVTYLNHADIRSHLGATHAGLRARMNEFQNEFNLNPILAGVFINIMPLWDEGITLWGNRMQHFARTWINNHIITLTTVWMEAARTAPTQAMRDEADQILAILRQLGNEADNLSINLSGT